MLIRGESLRIFNVEFRKIFGGQAELQVRGDRAVLLHLDTMTDKDRAVSCVTKALDNAGVRISQQSYSGSNAYTWVFEFLVSKATHLLVIEDYNCPRCLTGRPGTDSLISEQTPCRLCNWPGKENQWRKELKAVEPDLNKLHDRRYLEQVREHKAASRRRKTSK